jgi:hypothetical protein
MEYSSTIGDFFAGDSFSWLITHESYKPIDGYSCKVVLLNSQTRIEYTANGDISSNTYTITKSNTDTSLLTPSKYKCYIVFIKNVDGFVKQYDNNKIEIKENALTAASIETRSEAQIQLEVVKALISGRLVDGINAFTIAGRSVTLMTMTELLDVEKKLSVKVEQELNLIDITNHGRTNRNKLKIRYTGISV